MPGGRREIDSRRAALRALAEHFADGRLTVAELERRKQWVDAAVTTADLRAVFHDLPHPRPEFAERRSHRPVIALVLILFLVMIVVFIGVIVALAQLSGLM